MRCSSLVSLVLVTASLALGGCAADAEPGSSEPATSEAALTGLGTPSVDKTTKHAKYAANADEAARTRITNVYDGVAANRELTDLVAINKGRAAHPVELVNIKPAFGAHLPQEKQLSASSESAVTYETIDSASEKLEP